MARPATGTIVVKDTRGGRVYGARFPAYGRKEYVTLGNAADGMSREDAERKLAHIIADVERGIWKPLRPEPVTGPREVPTFHEFASQWFERQTVEGGRRGGGLTAAGVADLQWRLSNHLLPYFAAMRLDAITVERVDAYRTAKVRAGKLNPTSVNKTLQVLSAILEAAVEYGYIDRNPAAGRRRRLPSVTPARTVIDRADHIAALLDAAGTLDRDARTRHGQRRALLATAVLAGLRLGELLALRWRDVDLARGTIKVRASKTDAGVRDVPIVPALRDELTAYSAAVQAGPAALVFGSSTGQPQSPSNIRRRVLTPAVAAANVALADAGTVEPIPALTPHSLRRTAASVWFAVGWTPPQVMYALGHTTAELTLAVYARQMARQDGEADRLRALVAGADWTLDRTLADTSGAIGEFSDRDNEAA